jgi:hypothetical protein
MTSYANLQTAPPHTHTYNQGYSDPQLWHDGGGMWGAASIATWGTGIRTPNQPGSGNLSGNSGQPPPTRQRSESEEVCQLPHPLL